MGGAALGDTKAPEVACPPRVSPEDTVVSVKTTSAFFAPGADEEVQESPNMPTGQKNLSLKAQVSLL